MGGPCNKLEKQHSLIFNGQRSAADCIAQQSADSLENLVNYVPSLPNHNWPLHWSMPAHHSLKGRALIFLFSSYLLLPEENRLLQTLFPRCAW